MDGGRKMSQFKICGERSGLLSCDRQSAALLPNCSPRFEPRPLRQATAVAATALGPSRCHRPRHRLLQCQGRARRLIRAPAGRRTTAIGPHPPGFSRGREAAGARCGACRQTQTVCRAASTGCEPRQGLTCTPQAGPHEPRAAGAWPPLRASGAHGQGSDGGSGALQAPRGPHSPVGRTKAVWELHRAACIVAEFAAMAPTGPEGKRRGRSGAAAASLGAGQPC